MVRVQIELTQQPELRYAASGLAICTLRDGNVRYVAFAELAEELSKLVINDRSNVFVKLRLTGYYKKFKWVKDTIQYPRFDFIIKAWERINP